jgi:hypothetical protein
VVRFDLPAQDDDDLRSQPSVAHVIFGSWTMSLRRLCCRWTLNELSRGHSTCGYLCAVIEDDGSVMVPAWMLFLMLVIYFCLWTLGYFYMYL